MKEKAKKLLDYLAKNGKYYFPVIVCLAVAVTVVIALNAGGAREDKLGQIGEPISSPDSQTETSTDEIEEIALVKNENADVHNVIATYYNAMAIGDEDALNQVCDKVEDMDMLWYLETAKYIEYYPVLDIYTKPGFAEGDIVAFVYFKVKFTGKDAEYPGYQMVYVGCADDGSLYIKRTALANDANEYVLKISEAPDVLELTNRVKVEFNELMAEQPDLLVYMNDVDEEVRRMVGIKLGSQKGETQPDGESQGDGQEGSEGDNPGQADEPQTTDPQVEEVIYAIASTTVNVRKSDSEKAEKIGKVTGGTKVQVVEQLVNGWSKVLYDNNAEGFIMSKYLKIQESALKYTPIGVVKATDNINVRSDASTESSKMGTLVQGDTADLLAVEGEWCKINFNGQIAYVKAEYVERQ